MFSVHVIPVGCQNTYYLSNVAKDDTETSLYFFTFVIVNSVFLSLMLCIVPLKVSKKQEVGISSHAPNGNVLTREMMIMKSLRYVYYLNGFIKANAVNKDVYGDCFSPAKMNLLHFQNIS